MITPNEPQHEPAPHYEAFVMRLRWTRMADGARCQIMLQQSDQDVTRYFGSFEELVAFLRARDPHLALPADDAG